MAKPNCGKNRYFGRNYRYWASLAEEKKINAFGILIVQALVKVTAYVAEFFCIQVLSFIRHGHKSSELILGDCVSIASDAASKKWLLKVDKIGAGVTVLKSIRASYAFFANKASQILACCMAFIS